MDQFLELQQRLMQQMVRPNSDCMKEVFVEVFVRETVYEVHPSLWQSMQRDLMNVVMLYKEKDAELKQEQQRATTATSSTTTPMEACGLASAWQQPHLQLWSCNVVNPGSVWGSMDTGYVLPQQFIDPRHFSHLQQQPFAHTPQLGGISRQQGLQFV